VKPRERNVAYIVASEPLEVKRTRSAPVRSHNNCAARACRESVKPVCRPHREPNAVANASATTGGLWPRMFA